MTLLAFLLLGLFAGLLSGLFGIGGGLVIVPLLILLFRKSMTEAVGTSLGALLLPVGALAVMEYHRRGAVDWRAAGMLAVGMTLGAWFSARTLVGVLPPIWLHRGFGILLIVTGIKFLLKG